MEAIYTAETYNTPRLEYIPAEYKLSIMGKLIPENPEDFFKVIQDIVEQLKAERVPSFNVHLYLHYYNTSSSRRLMAWLKSLKKAEELGIKVAVNWCYDEDDEDALEDGEDYCEASDLHFTYTPVEEDDDE